MTEDCTPGTWTIIALILIGTIILLAATGG